MHQSKQLLSEYECDKDDIVWSMCIWCMWCWSRWYQVKYYLLGGISCTQNIHQSKEDLKCISSFFVFFCFLFLMVLKSRLVPNWKVREYGKWSMYECDFVKVCTRAKKIWVYGSGTKMRYICMWYDKRWRSGVRWNILCAGAYWKVWK